MDSKRKCYAVKNKSDNIRENSQSGGVFTAVSDRILNNGGVVYGCVMRDFYTVEHIRATTTADRDLMRGSKYIPSRMNNCYSLCAEDLSAGKQVLFTGTPCQVDALKTFLAVKKTDTANLLTIDLICHSVASPELWRKNLDYLSQGKKIEHVIFRDKKKFGWDAHKETIVVEGKEVSSKAFSDMFGLRLASPLHCFKCYYKNCDRVSDITIGDYWNIENLEPDFLDNKGTSLVILNTPKGEKFFSECRSDFEIREYFLMDSIQGALDYNFTVPKNRKHFFRVLRRKNFGVVSEKFLKPRKLIYTRIFSLAQKIIKR